jgi:hypothetical protein
MRKTVGGSPESVISGENMQKNFKTLKLKGKARQPSLSRFTSFFVF